LNGRVIDPFAMDSSGVLVFGEWHWVVAREVKVVVDPYFFDRNGWCSKEKFCGPVSRLHAQTGTNK